MTSPTAVLSGRLDFFQNPKADANLVYGPQRQAMLSVAKGEQALEMISTWPNYQVTDLHLLTSMAEQANIRQI